MKNKELKAKLIDAFIRLDNFNEERERIEKQYNANTDICDEVLYVAKESLADLIRYTLNVEHAGHYVREYLRRKKEPYTVPLLETYSPEDAKAFVEFLFDYQSITDEFERPFDIGGDLI